MIRLIWGHDMSNNLQTTTENKTSKFFTNLNNPQPTVSQNVNDAIVGYFEEYTKNREAALLLAQAVIDTAASQREDPMTVLTQFQNLPDNELNAVLALFLNTNRIPTSLLGVKNKPMTNPYVTRTILF